MILTVTDELCITAVVANPRRVAKKGLVSEENVARTAGESFIPDIADDIELSPMKSVPKPVITSPTFLTVGFFPTIIMRTPARSIIGAIRSSLNDTRRAVTQVPILGPNITPAAWYKFVSPGFTKLTTIAVHADED